MDADTFAAAAANFYSELNAAHPFIEGNGRTMRLFLQMIAENADYSLELKPEDKDAWNEGARLSFLPPGDLRPLTQLIRSRISYFMSVSLDPGDQIKAERTAAESAKWLNGDLSPSYVRAEFKRRLDVLNARNTYVSIYSTLHNAVSEEIARVGIKKVDWKQVERRVIRESIGEHGHTPQDVYQVIAGFSPGTISFKHRENVRQVIKLVAPELQALYKRKNPASKNDFDV